MTPYPTAALDRNNKSSISALMSGSATLAFDHVHLWIFSFDLLQGRMAALSQCLSEDEHARAHRYRFAEDRERFKCWRILLRELLGHYTGNQPRSIEFAYTEFGKPKLHPKKHEPLQFNLSHSGDLALFAFSRNRVVGIDVERIDDHFDCLDIASRYFPKAEQVRLQRSSPGIRLREFYRCWTRREAYFKATGGGLADLTPALEVHEGLNRGLHNSKADWFTQTVDVGSNYAASLVVEGNTPWCLTLKRPRE